MLLGHVDLIDHCGVRGWAVDTDRPFVAIEVAIFGNGRLIGIQLADQPREDLQDASWLRSGNHGFVFTFDPPLAAERDHEIAVRFVDGGRLVGQWRVTQAKGPHPAGQDTNVSGGDDEAVLRTLIGHVDRCDATGITGWAICEEAPDEIVSVAISLDGGEIARIACDKPREDLAAVGRYGNGAHGFVYMFETPGQSPAKSQDNGGHEVAIRFAESGKLIGQWRVQQSRPLAGTQPDENALGRDKASPSQPLIGFVDRCDANGVAGWAARKDAPNEIVSVVILMDEREIARVACDIPRDDLAASGLYGTGAHGFEYQFEMPIPSGTISQIDVRFAETEFALEGSGWTISGVTSDERDVPQISLTSAQNAVGNPVPRFVGYVDTISHRELIGWAADRERPDTPVTVLVFVNGQRLAAIRCDDLRPDIVRGGKWTSEGHGFRFAFDPPLPERADTQIVVRFLDSAEVLTNGQREFLASRPDELLRPILVTAPGRSGTTMLMERLGKCPEIVVANSHPYEIRMLSYYATAHRVLTAGADFKRSTHPDRLEGDGFFVGFNPFSEEDYEAAFEMKSRHKEFFSSFIPDETLRAFRHIITEYYERHRDEQQKVHARFFAEKNNNLDTLPRQFARVMFGPTKEIVLVRDPRDLYCSRLSYFKNIAERTLLQEVRWACTQLLEIREAATPDMIFIKYEDIIQNNAAELARLSAFLGFDFDMNIGTDDAKFAIHGTSASPASSVGRWRTQLSKAEVTMFDESGGEFFEIFRYERGNG